jgi:DNA-binding IscR family transcriptional regulator
MVMSPVGHMLLKPVPARENIQKIERAKQAILAALDASEAVALRHLARRADISPAALSSAVLLLKQAGAIRTEGGRIVRA